MAKPTDAKPEAKAEVDWSKELFTEKVFRKLRRANECWDVVELTLEARPKSVRVLERGVRLPVARMALKQAQVKQWDADEDAETRRELVDLKARK